MKGIRVSFSLSAFLHSFGKDMSFNLDDQRDLLSKRFALRKLEYRCDGGATIRLSSSLCLI